MDHDRELNVRLCVDALTVNVVHSADSELKALFHLLHKEITKMADEIQARLDELAQDVTDETTATQSAITLINGIPALIAAAIAAAQGAGATPAQLQAFTELNAKIKTNAADLAAAVVTGNTPPTPGA